MNFPSARNHLAALLLGAALLAPAMAQTVLALPAAQAPGSDVRQALTVPTGGTLRIDGTPLRGAVLVLLLRIPQRCLCVCAWCPAQRQAHLVF